MTNDEHQKLKATYKSDMFIFKTDPDADESRREALLCKVLADWVVIGWGSTPEEATARALEAAPDWRDPNAAAIS